MQELTAPWVIDRTLVVKAEEDTDSHFGKKPKERSIHEYIRLGIINLDNPAGPSSHEVASWVKHILGHKRAGHGGTLET